MEDKKMSALFEEMKDDVSNYVTNTFELGKLEVYEKLSIGSAVITFYLVVAGVSLFALLFVFITLALYLAEVLQSLWMGFGIVTLAAVLLVLILLLAKKPFKKGITNSIIRFLMKRDEKDEKKQPI